MSEAAKPPGRFKWKSLFCECSVRRPSLKTKPRLKANSATTVHAGDHSSCCSHRLKAGWFSAFSLQLTPELVKPLTVQLSGTIRHVSLSRSVWLDTWRRRLEAEETDGWGKQIFTEIQTAADPAAVQCDRPDVKTLFSPEGSSSGRISFRIYYQSRRGNTEQKTTF